MPFIQDDDITEEWSAAETLAENEDWQVQWGTLLMSWDAEPTGDDGLEFTAGSIIQLSVGETIRYRRKDSRPVKLNRQVRA